MCLILAATWHLKWFNTIKKKKKNLIFEIMRCSQDKLHLLWKATGMAEMTHRWYVRRKFTVSSGDALGVVSLLQSGCSTYSRCWCDRRRKTISIILGLSHPIQWSQTQTLLNTPAFNKMQIKSSLCWWKPLLRPFDLLMNSFFLFFAHFGQSSKILALQTPSKKGSALQ